ncbi:UMP kinase [Elusimicrobiota bacterium]
MDKNLTVMSLGGSLIIPGEKIDVRFLRSFRKLILEQVKVGRRLVIVSGGGRLARHYQQAARSLARLRREDVDLLGIYATRINAALLRTIFLDYAHPKIIRDPRRKIEFREPICLAAGWKPGFSSDHDTVLIAKNLGAKKLVNLTNVDFVLDKEGRPKKRIGWADYRCLIPREFSPGLSVPFGPIASRLAQKMEMEVAVINGRKLREVRRYLAGRDFAGTVIA